MPSANSACSLLMGHVTRDDVERVVRSPETLRVGVHGRMVAQRGITETHVLRVVYEESEDELVVVTFYPGRKDRYEGNV